MAGFRYSPIGGGARSSSADIRPSNTRRMLMVAAVAFLSLLGYSLHFHRDYVTATISTATSGWLPKIDLEGPRLSRILELEKLKVELVERFEHHQNTDVRNNNVERIDGLIKCIADGTCGKNQETIVVMASFHFGNARLGSVAGEDIWALALDEAIESLGYTGLYAYGHTEALTMWLAVPEMITRFIMEASDLEACIARDEKHQTNHLHNDHGEWQEMQQVKVGCIKKKGYEEGIPMWMVHSFHGWPNAAHILGSNFTVSLEPFREMGVGSNYYLGYSIETRCKQIDVPNKKEHQGMVLGKNTQYFSPPDNGFPNMLAPAAAAIPQGEGADGVVTDFKIVAVAGKAGEELAEPGLENKGFMSRAMWYEEVAKSKVLIGIGRPPQSPSAYDAMCLGTPFINPNNGWKRDDPDNKKHWQLQQPALVDAEPPYVYTVRKGDEEGFRAALAAAVANPIERYILPRMTRQAMNDRMDHFLNFDWKTEAERIIAIREETTGEPYPFDV